MDFGNRERVWQSGRSDWKKVEAQHILLSYNGRVDNENSNEKKLI